MGRMVTSIVRLSSLRYRVTPFGRLSLSPSVLPIIMSRKSPMIFVVFSMFSLLVFFYGCAVVE